MPNTKQQFAVLHDEGRGKISICLFSGSYEWHRLHVICDAPFGEWEFRDECLLVYETQQWIDWLRHASAISRSSSDDARTALYPAKPLQEIGFIERTIRMELIAAGNSWVRLRTGFHWRAWPKHVFDVRFSEGRPVWMDLCLPAQQLNTLADLLEEQASKLPGG